MPSTARCSRRRRRGHRRGQAPGLPTTRRPARRGRGAGPRPTTAGRWTRSEVVLGLDEDAAQPGGDVLELGRPDGERRRQLDDRVAAVVGATVDAGVEKRLGQEAAEQPLALVVVERLPGRLVLDQFDAVEEAGAADVTDERKVTQPVEGGAEDRGVGLDVVGEALALEDVEVGHRRRAGHRVSPPGVAVREIGQPGLERLEQPVRGHHEPQGRVARGDALRGRDDVGDIAEVVAGED